MTPQEYQSNWTTQNDTLNAFNQQKLISSGLQPHSIGYLEMGLPVDAAPFLSFVSNNGKTPGSLPKLTEHYSFSGTGFDQYLVIGSDGGGNPLVINKQNNDSIELLDHEANFSNIAFVNSSIGQFLKSITIYRDFINSICALNDETAFIEEDFTNEQVEAMRQQMHDTDQKALTNSGFWQAELNALMK